MSKKEAGLIMKIRITQLIIFILMITVVSCVSGCIGGRSVSAKGTGTTITASRLVQQPNGIFKLEPVEITPPKSKPVDLGPIKVHPAQPDLTSAKPTIAKPKVNAIPAGEIPKKDPPKIIIPQLPALTNQTGELPIIIDTTGNKYSLTPIEESKVKVDWTKLINFYLASMVFLSLIYLGYKQYKKKNKQKR
jgi:hypothetical protein